MKTKYKWINFKKRSGLTQDEIDYGMVGDDAEWVCFNNRSDTALCDIYYLGTWRQYAIETKSFMEFNKGCLEDIADFLNQLNETKGRYKLRETK